MNVKNRYIAQFSIRRQCVKPVLKKGCLAAGLVMASVLPCFAIENLSDQQLATRYFNDLPLPIDTNTKETEQLNDQQQADDNALASKGIPLNANNISAQKIDDTQAVANNTAIAAGAHGDALVTSLISEANLAKLSPLTNHSFKFDLNDPDASINLLGSLGIDNLSDEVKAKLRTAQGQALLHAQHSENTDGVNGLANGALGGLLNQIIIKSVGLTPFSYRFKGNTAQIIMQPRDVIVDYYYGRINNETDFELVNINAGIREISVTYSR